MTLAHFLKDDCSNVIKEDSLSLMGHCAYVGVCHLRSFSDIYKQISTSICGDI